MTGDEFGITASGAAALLSFAWAVSRDQKTSRSGRRRADAQAETDRLGLALDGFDKLVADMRTEIDRGQSERNSLLSQISILTAHIDELKAQVNLRDSEIAALREQVRILTEKAASIG